MRFSEEDVIKEAVRIYGKSVCTDMINDAMQEETLEQAAMTLVLDSSYWDGTFMDGFK